MFSRLKLSAQISLGYALVMAMLIAVSITAYFGQSKATSGFDDYRELARTSNLASQVEIHMLLTSLCQGLHHQPESRFVASVSGLFLSVDGISQTS